MEWLGEGDGATRCPERNATNGRAQQCRRGEVERRHQKACCIWALAVNPADGQLGRPVFSPRMTEQTNAWVAKGFEQVRCA
jgi:hypothetical protein